MNRAKAKGTAFETAVVKWLRDLGWDAERIVLHGNKDEGDVIIRNSPWSLELKNCRTLALGQWIAEADAEAANAGRPVAVVAKRVGKGDPGEAYVVMPLRVFVSSVLGYDVPRGDDDAASR